MAEGRSALTMRPEAGPAHGVPSTRLAAARQAALWSAAGVLLAMPTVLAFYSGGYGVRSQLFACAVAFVALGVLAVAAPWPLLSRGPGLVALAALAGLAAWTLASLGWTRIHDRTADEVAQLTLYAVAFAGGLVVLRDTRLRRLTPAIFLAGIAAVAAYALAGRLLPDLFAMEVSPRAGARIQQPLTYWNAMGLLMALGLVLSAVLAGDGSRTHRLRAAACAVAVPCGLVLYLTFSRGSLVAAAAGFLVVLLTRPRRSTLLAGALVVGFTVMLAVSLEFFPAARELEETTARQTSQGAVVALLLAVATFAAGFAFARLSPRGAESRLPISRRLRTVAALAAVAGVLGLGWLIAFGSERTEPLSSSSNRLTTINTNRGEYWRVAVDSWGAHPLTGVGAGSFGVEWRRERDSGESALDAHSIYLETLAELGAVGGLLLTALIAATVAGLVPRLRDDGDMVAPAAAACGAAFLVHAGLDWTWEFPAVVLVVLLLVAAGIQREPRRQAPHHG